MSASALAMLGVGVALLLTDEDRALWRLRLAGLVLRGAAMTATPRLAVVCDFREELWPSMDLTAAMVLAHLGSEHADEFTASRVCPPFRHRLGRLPAVGRSGTARNVDRLLNRMVDYPRYLGRVARRNEFDLYHLVDHSYSQLVHALPPGRVVVTCHDVDTFRCLLEPDREPRPAWFRAMALRILDGLRRASAVACDSEVTRDALLAHEILPSDRLHVVHLGLSPEFSPDPDPAADAEAARLLGPTGPASPLELLHVGSNIPRKRIDVLLSVFAGVALRPARRPADQGRAAFSRPTSTSRPALGISDAITVIPHIGDRRVRWPPSTAARCSRSCRAMPRGSDCPRSRRSPACPLLASDLAVLREVAGDAAVYRPVGDVASWTEAALSLLDEPAGGRPFVRSEAPPGSPWPATFRGRSTSTGSSRSTATSSPARSSPLPDNPRNPIGFVSQQPTRGGLRAHKWVRFVAGGVSRVRDTHFWGVLFGLGSSRRDAPGSNGFVSSRRAFAAPCAGGNGFVS